MISRDVLTNQVNLIVDRLEVIENCGDGALIHEARHFLCIIRGQHALSDWVGHEAEHTKKCLEYMQDAETWLVSLVKGVS